MSLSSNWSGELTFSIFYGELRTIFILKVHDCISSFLSHFAPCQLQQLGPVHSFQKLTPVGSFLASYTILRDPCTYKKWKSVKNTYQVTWMWGRRREGSAWLQICAQETEFLICQCSQSCDRLGSCLVTEHLMMKSSMLFWVWTRPSCIHLTSFMW